MQPYSHRQHNPFIPMVLAIMLIVVMGALLTIPRGVDPGPLVTPVMLIIIVAALIGMLSRLTTRVESGIVTWYFGFGFPRGKRTVSHIARAELTRTSFLEGWGLHWTIWHGWLWNVYGFQAVEIFGNDGSRVTIGTDDPQGFLDAINRARLSTNSG